MGIDYSAKNVEVNGGSVYIYKIPDSVIADYSTWAAPNAVADVADWSGPTAPDALTYVSMGATDSNSIDITIDRLEVFCDQTASKILNPKTATGATITCVVEEHLMWRYAIALGLDFEDTADMTTASIFSPLTEAAISRAVAYFGDFKSDTFFDVKFEKYRTANKTKIIGWRLPKAQVTEGPSFAFKHGETDFYEIVFEGMAFDFDNTQPYYNHIVTPYMDTV
jgi:hypothetical protein